MPDSSDALDLKSDHSDYHEPVMPAEVLHYLAPQPGEVILDATLGGGGHSALLAAQIQPGGTLIGIDRDADALESAGARLAKFQTHVDIILLRSDFGKLNFAIEADNRAKSLKLDGALFDLGVSSHQLDTQRGFSFRRNEPLDMRMDAASGRSAAQFLAEESEAEIARVLFDYGEERASRKIARRIVERRERGEPVQTTAQLAALVEGSIPRSAWPRDINVSTRTFQGLRIAVNDELGQLQSGLDAAISRLAPGGRIAVISYHSLEDRIVKQTFARDAGKTGGAPGSSPAAFLPSVTNPILEIITRKPVSPTAAEIAQNPRARSARLRVARKI